MMLKIVNSCLSCDNKIPMNKMFCSKKCFNESKRQCESQNGSGSFGFDASDIWLKPVLHKRTKIKKKTEAKLAKEEGRF